MTNRFPFWLLALTLLLAPACAGRMGPTDEGAARAKWEAFQARMRQADAASPFFLTGTLSYQDQDKGHRLLFTMYGQDTAVRLDLSASVGQQVAAWLEDETGWHGYFPMDKKAFTAPDSKQAAARMGVPLPFGLRELSRLSLGRLGELIPPDYSRASSAKDGYLFELPGSSLFAGVTLDFEGNLLHLTARGRPAWRIALSDYPAPGDQGPRVARTIDITGDDSRSVTLRLRRIESRPQGFDARALALPVPADVPVRSLDDAADAAPVLDVRSRRP